MPKAKLTPLKIETARHPGLLNDGGGLCLNIAGGGSKSWCFRFTLGNRRRTMGLGGIASVNLEEARERARECRALVEQGIDPIDYCRGWRALAAPKTAMTFRKAALAYIDAHKDGWSDATAEQWPYQFELYVFPEIGALPIQAVNDARWPEFDLAARIWTIPAKRMKMRREHRVALNEPALAILRKVEPLKRGENDFVFPGLKAGKPLSQHVMKTLMRCMGYAGIATAHGFRSTFKDWATEQTGFSTEAIELALAHAVGNKVEAAYRRGDLLEKRRLLSKAWGDFCLGLTPLAASNLIPFPGSVPDDRATQTVPVAASNSQKQPQTRQPRSLPLAAKTASVLGRSPQQRRRVPVRTADLAQLSLDFGPPVEQPVSRAEGRSRR